MKRRKDPLVVTVFHSKGGVAKTTTAVNLATSWRGRVHLFDIDAQEATRMYSKSLEDVPATYCDANAFVSRLGESQSEINVVDCPPHPNLALPALRIADLVVIPFTSEFASYREMKACYDEVKAITQAPVVTFISRFYPERPAHRAIRSKAREELGEVFLNSTIFNRAIFDEACLHRSSVLDYAPETDAAKRVKALADEIANRLNISPMAEILKENNGGNAKDTARKTRTRRTS